MQVPALTLAALSVSMAQAGPAGAQANGLFFSFPNGKVYDGSAPVTVELWAFFDPQYYAWAGMGSNIVGDPSGQFSNLQLAMPNTPGTDPGLPVNGSVGGIIAGQLHLPAGGFFASTANPILIWTAQWSTPTLSGRVVSISTAPDQFFVYQNFEGLPLSLPPSAVDQAKGKILVVPSAPVLTMLAMCGVMCARRRR